MPQSNHTPYRRGLVLTRHEGQAVRIRHNGRELVIVVEPGNKLRFIGPHDYEILRMELVRMPGEEQ